VTGRILEILEAKFGADEQIFTYMHCVSKKLHPFYFCDYLVKCWLISIIFDDNVAAEKICNQMTYSLLITSSLCTNVT